MKKFKSFYEDMTFKVEVEGLPALFMAGNSPGQVKSHLRKLIKQPSMIKSVERQTKHDVKKMYRAKAQGKDLDESKNEPAREYDYEGEMTKQQLRTIEMAAKELQSMISDNQNLPEWWQNKITLAADYMQTARDYMKSDVKENAVNEQLDERTPVRPTVQDKELKNLRVPNPNYKGLLKRKEKPKRAMYNDVTSEGTMGNKPEWGTLEATRKAKKVTPGETCENNCGCDKCKRKMDEKLTIGKIRRAAYKTGKVLGDVQAVKKGKVVRRVKNRILGKMVGKALGGLWK